MPCSSENLRRRENNLLAFVMMNLLHCISYQAASETDVIKRQVYTENPIPSPIQQPGVHHLSLIELKAAGLNLCFNTLRCHKEAHIFLPTFTMNLKQHTPATLK